ncbi:serine/threonine-protein kinase RsbW [Sulfitobacter marinus]|uniref:Serine/threonine-protein kinase RsbW n=1 Tax=Sulfitobacter marinus TaxID=394264 RepID=A0A1I6TLI7_9RHOB|nr:ATP-binding protein [Sulfitobacter marinus]SFS90035.1 serine/threonine-protein kinase RsbW [Sulfitobacter marinus]
MATQNKRDKVKQGGAPEVVFDLSLVGTMQDVRDALKACRAQLYPICKTAQKLDDIELVMAETFNNIVEHALAGQTGNSPIHVSCTKDGDLISLVFRDVGTPFANNVAPGRGQVGTAAHAQSLPEGGFGWGLIHHLAQDISYVRVKQHNVLTIVIDVATPPASVPNKPSQ